MVPWSLVLAIVLLLGVVTCVALIGILNRNNSLKNTTPIAVNPVTSATKQNCQAIRTPCDPQNPNSCSASCDEQELRCVNLDAITPSAAGKEVNGGGYVCLPEIPSIACNVDNGGVYVWTG